MLHNVNNEAPNRYLTQGLHCSKCRGKVFLTEDKEKQGGTDSSWPGVLIKLKSIQNLKVNPKHIHKSRSCGMCFEVAARAEITHSILK